MNQEKQGQEPDEVVQPVMNEVESDSTEIIDETLEQETTPSDDDAAFQAGFDSVDAGEPEPEPEPVKLFGKYTEEEFHALLDKAAEVDKLKEREAKVFGTLGSLKQAIDQLKERPTQAAATKINAKLERMSAEYPEMAEALRADLSEMETSGPAFDPDAMQRVVTEQLAKADQKSEMRFLTILHPDWRDIAASPEFDQWKGGLPPDELEVANTSWDAESINKVLSKFKASKAQTSQAKQVRTSRLEAAITPRGRALPTSAQTEEDAFVSGWKSADKGL